MPKYALDFSDSYTMGH